MTPRTVTQTGPQRSGRNSLTWLTGTLRGEHHPGSQLDPVSVCITVGVHPALLPGISKDPHSTLNR